MGKPIIWDVEKCPLHYIMSLSEGPLSEVSLYYNSVYILI